MQVQSKQIHSKIDAVLAKAGAEWVSRGQGSKPFIAEATHEQSEVRFPFPPGKKGHIATLCVWA